MNLSPSPSDHLAELVLQLGRQLQDVVAKSTGLEPALVTARELEQLSLEAGLPLVAGAAICLQQRLPSLLEGPAARKAFKVLAQAWLKHGPKLLSPAGDPALDHAWIALQPHLAITIEEETDPTAFPVDGEMTPVADEAPVDAGAFLDSLDVVEPPVAGSTAVPFSAPLAAPEPVLAAPAPAPTLAPAPAPAPVAVPVVVEEEPVPLEILEAFAQESREAFEAMEQSIMAWEKNNCPVEDLRNVFRLAHSVKGAANSVGLRAVGTVLHRLEDTLEDLVEGRGYLPTQALSALVLSLIDALRSALAGGQSATPAWKGTADQLIERITTLQATMTTAPIVEVPEMPAVVAPVVEDFPAAPVAFVAEVAPAIAAMAESAALVPTQPKAVPVAVEAKAEQSTIRVEISHLDKLMNLVGDLLINRHRLNRKLKQVTSLRGELMRARERLLHVVGDFNEHHEFSQRRQAAVQTPSDGFSELEMDRYDDFNILSRSLVEIAADAEEIITQIDGHFGTFSEEAVQFTNVTRQLQEDVARTRMVPLDQLFRRLQRAVRDACSSEGKVVTFVVEGAENRIDKFISDQLFRPLLHIVRNAVAHGIEPAAERLAAGKPAEGRLLVRSRTEAGRLALELIDDGGGLQRDAIIRVARTRGLLAPNAVPDDTQLAELIFQPGFSTAASTTDVSGRGVGLDVARQELTNLGGTVTVVSRPGQGCSFVLTLPVTLAINQVMFVECGEQVFALPINFVERVVPAQPSAFSHSGSTEMLMLDKQQTVPVIRLHSRLGLPDVNQAVTAVILTVAERRTALIVDRIQSKVDIVVKPLGPLLNRHPFFSGATLAGDGRVIFILDVPSVLAPGATRSRSLPVPRVPESVARAEAGEGSRRILVVDDSLSIRRIAANYLTRAGLEVDTAVDGSDALEKLRAGGFALVVSDLEMPRVNGFELIAEMRRHPDLEKIPVIILTSRDAAKHRDRARELGAADYLIKPVSREQLTEVVTALLERNDTAS